VIFVFTLFVISFVSLVLLILRLLLAIISFVSLIFLVLVLVVFAVFVLVLFVLVLLVFVLVLVFVFVFVTFVLGRVFFQHFFRQVKVVPGFFVRRIITEGFFISFYRFLVLFVFHKHVPQVVIGFMFFFRGACGFSCLFVACKCFTEIFPAVIGISQIVPGGGVFRVFGYGFSVTYLGILKIVPGEFLVGFISKVFGDPCRFFCFLIFFLFLGISQEKRQK